jgi:myo-inositol-1(or 4)-monophosphatase
MMRAVFRPSTELRAMMTAASRAGAGLMGRFRRVSELRVELKGRADFVSAADRESEETVRSLLLGRYPRFGFLTEESPPRAGADPSARFIVDPLDGTTNFLHGVPHFAVAVALEHEAEIVAGVVLDPAKNEAFVAERGKGAWLRGARLRVRSDRDMSRALVATGIPHAGARRRHGPYLAMLAPVMREAAGIRRFAAAALDLSYVAAGRFAAYFELGLELWDIAAGTLLVREAGGAVSEPDGGPDYLRSGDVLATNGRLHARMLAIIRRGARTAASAQRPARKAR